MAKLLLQICIFFSSFKFFPFDPTKHRQLHEKQEAESSFLKKKFFLIHWIMGDKIMKNFPPKP